MDSGSCLLKAMVIRCFNLTLMGAALSYRSGVPS